MNENPIEDTLGVDAGVRQLIDGVSSEPGAHTELFARAAWARLAEPGDSTAGSLIAALGAAHALAAVIAGVQPAAAGVRPIDAERFAKGLATWRPRLDKAAVIEDIERAAAHGVQLIVPSQPLWPAVLGDLGDHMPVVLWVRGDAQLLSSPGIAVVGARACTSYGAQVTSEITEGLCNLGLTIFSGAAYGIDAAAHRTALAIGGGTVAVLAGGVDRPYPSGHAELLHRIAAAGAVCSEMVPGSAPTKWRFLMRNRVIAALSRATLVTEAGMRSGTLNTAAHAAELGRPLGAVPGPITSPASTGCHRLIREYDAALITNSRDVQELLGIGEPLTLFDTAEELVARGGNAGGIDDDRPPPLHRRVLDALPLRGSRALDAVVRESGASEAEVRGALAELELLGRVARVESATSAEVKWKLLKQ